MEELIKCSREQFRAKLGEISIKEMQKVLWDLEARYENMPKTSMTMPGEIDERLDLRNKIQVCQERLLAAKYEALGRSVENIKPFETMNFSWGIRETEPSIVLDAKTGRKYWIKVGGNQPVPENETIKIVDCGEFRWCEQEAITIDDMPDQEKGMPLKVTVTINDDGTRTVDGADLIKEIYAAEAQSGKLRVLRVIIHGEKQIEYFMLGEIKGLQEMDPEKLRTYLVSTYLSKAHQNAVMSSLEGEQCLYGGTIVQNEEGRLETRFYDIVNRAVAMTNLSNGTCKSRTGRIKGGHIQDVLDGISGSLRRREAIEGLKENFRPGDGR